LSFMINERGRMRFIGDTEKMEYHDLLYEIEGQEGCGIDDIFRKESAVGFFPDKANQARMEGYKPCRKCNE
jgi:hypothetical protein